MVSILTAVPAPKRLAGDMIDNHGTYLRAKKMADETPKPPRIDPARELFITLLHPDSTARLWKRVPTPDRATLDLALALGHASDSDYHWLMREIGEEPSTPGQLNRPSWIASEGKLSFGGSVVRRVRIMGEPTNIQIILDAFQAANWPDSIPNPLTDGQQQLHQALRTLNHPLTGIRFHSKEGGRFITWSRV
jgi:hypothetical protein